MDILTRQNPALGDKRRIDSSQPYALTWTTVMYRHFKKLYTWNVSIESKWSITVCPSVTKGQRHQGNVLWTIIVKTESIDSSVWERSTCSALCSCPLLNCWHDIDCCLPFVWLKRVQLTRQLTLSGKWINDGRETDVILLSCIRMTMCRMISIFFVASIVVIMGLDLNSTATKRTWKSLASMSCSDSRRCGCYKGNCWAYIDEYQTPSTGWWCFTQRQGVRGKEKAWAKCTDSSQCSWTMTCGDCFTWVGKRTGIKTEKILCWPFLSSSNKLQKLFAFNCHLRSLLVSDRNRNSLTLELRKITRSRRLALDD